jgi:hypothetical protein
MRRSIWPRMQRQARHNRMQPALPLSPLTPTAGTDFMDENRFETLIRSLSSRSSRRGVLASLISGLLMALTFVLSGEDAESKKRRKKKRRRCSPHCAGKSCGADGCGGSCGECNDGRTCQSGICVCAAACCADVDCGSGKLCLKGQCVTGTGTCAQSVNTCDLATKPACGGTCYCLPTIDGAIRCAAGLTCGTPCASHAECASLGAGAFCGGAGALCCVTGSRCQLPCPS